MERWKDVPSYEGRYQVSDQGRVRGPSGKVLKPFPHRCGYLQVKLCRGWTDQATRFVHRLVALAFIPCIEGADEVDHIDHDRTNNSAGNLRWADRSANMAHAGQAGRLSSPKNVGEAHGMAVLCGDDIPMIRNLRAAGRKHQDIADFFGVSRRTIGMVLSGKRWGHVR